MRHNYSKMYNFDKCIYSCNRRTCISIKGPRCVADVQQMCGRCGNPGIRVLQGSVAMSWIFQGDFQTCCTCLEDLWDLLI